MPTTPTYPGVYIEEIPSGVRTITGVATSITAFIGRAVRGEENEPIPIYNFGDFESQFGGLHPNYPMSYAVRNFYLGGGERALCVRLYAKPAAGTGRAGWQSPGAGTNVFKLEANSRGTLGNNLMIQVNHDIAPDAAVTYNLDPKYLFNLIVREYVTERGERRVVAEERFLTVAIKADAGERRIDRVLASESQLVRIPLKADGQPDLPTGIERPEPTKAKDDDGGDGNGGDGNGGDGNGGDGNGGNGNGGNGNGGNGNGGNGNGGDGNGGNGGNGNGGNGTAVVYKTQLTKAREEEEKKFEALTGGLDSDPLKLEHYTGSLPDKTGLYALEKADLFNLLCIPPDDRQKDLPIAEYSAVYQEAMEYCRDRRAMLIVDPPLAWGKNKAKAAEEARKGLDSLKLKGLPSRNACLYFPRIEQADPKRENRTDIFAASGTIAGVMAMTDATRGVWKAPAGLDAALNGVQGLQVNLTDDENGALNPLGINCLRTFPVFGSVVWGARTLRGADQLADEYKYVPVRRFALFLEESLYRSLKWVVFEPNDEPLWAQIRLNVGAFMQNLFRQGAFQGQTPQKAYFVKCDSETTTQNDINLGIVNIVVGFAPLKPAEFVILKIQQIAGEIEV
jgi:uncharacterized protein